MNPGLFGRFKKRGISVDQAQMISMDENPPLPPKRDQAHLAPSSAKKKAKRKLAKQSQKRNKRR